jgi:hypothetical protein
MEDKMKNYCGLDNLMLCEEETARHNLRKIDIFVRNVYACSTNSHKLCRAAKDGWLDIYHGKTETGAQQRRQYPNVTHNDVTARFDRTHELRGGKELFR